MLQPKDMGWLNGCKNKIHIFCFLQKMQFRSRDTYRLNWGGGGWIKVFHANGKGEKS